MGYAVPAEQQELFASGPHFYSSPKRGSLDRSESPMAAAGDCSTTAREAREKLCERCSLLCPGLSDRASRSSWGLKLTMVLLHLLFVGTVFLFDADLIRRTREEPWYTAIYFVVFVATLVQYFFTCGSSPGYVVDAVREVNGTTTTFVNTHSILNKQSQSNSIKGNIVSSQNDNQLETQTSQPSSSSWLKVVVDLYPPGSAIRNWNCTYCNIVQPPRSKHCHDCDKCILQFDHHCVWLGTCVGQRNHGRFWWYIFLETILSTWTVVLYISLLRSKIAKAWWKDFIVVILLASLMFCLIFLLLLLLFHSYLALTNQTTYEMVRRRRILYMRGIPEKVHPFSRGICRNLYKFCCSRDTIYDLEAVPTMEELEARAKPYTTSDLVSCRCC